MCGVGVPPELAPNPSLLSDASQFDRQNCVVLPSSSPLLPLEVPPELVPPVLPNPLPVLLPPQLAALTAATARAKTP
jgi:hypothetical protein